MAPTRPVALLASLIALFFAALLCPFVGRYSDRVGRRRTILTAGVALIVAVYPASTLAASGTLLASALGAMLLAVGAVICGVVTAVAALRAVPHPGALHRLSLHLQPGLHHLRRHRAADRHLADRANRRPHVAGLSLIVIALLALVGGLALPRSSKRPLELPGGLSAYQYATE